MQMGGVYIASNQEEGILLQKYHNRNGRRTARLFTIIGVRGRCDSPECSQTIQRPGPRFVEFEEKRMENRSCPKTAFVSRHDTRSRINREVQTVS